MSINNRNSQNIKKKCNIYCVKIINCLFYRKFIDFYKIIKNFLNHNKWKGRVADSNDQSNRIIMK